MEIVDDFQVGLHSDIESIVLEMTGNVFPNSSASAPEMILNTASPSSLYRPMHSFP